MTELIAPNTTEIPDLFDENDPRSIINLVPPRVRAALENVPGDILEMTVMELEQQLPRKKWSAVDERLRTSFWNEYARAQERGMNMNMRMVIQGICSEAHFWNKFLPDKVRVAYLFTPPLNFTASLDALIIKGFDRLNEIINLPFMQENEKGQLILDAKVVDQVRKVVLDAYKIRYGMPVQRNVNVNVEAKDKDEFKEIQNSSMDELNRRLEELEEKQAALGINTRDVMDVEEGE